MAIQELVDKEKQLIHTKHGVEEEIRSFTTERDSKRHEILAVEGEVKRLRDIDSQKLNVVRRVDRATYDAIIWLRGHKDEFEDMIYEPPLMTVSDMPDLFRGGVKHMAMNPSCSLSYTITAKGAKL